VQEVNQYFFETWYDKLNSIADSEQMGQNFWSQLIQVRSEVNKELERQRAADLIGAGLEAEVELYVSPELYQNLATLGDELRFVLITSAARIYPQAEQPDDAIATELDGLAVKVNVSTHEKCVRCWHRREDVGRHAEHPELCGRCVENVAGTGEVRHFA